MERRTVLKLSIGALLGASTGLGGLRAAMAAGKDIVYLTPGLDLPFWRYLAKGVEATVKAQGYNFQALDSHNSAQTQLQNAQDAIARGVAGIVISPTDSSTAPSVLALAKRAKIPAVVADIGTKSVALRRQHLYKKLGRVLVAGGIVLIGAALFGALIKPLGFTGLLALMVLLIGVAVLFGKWPPFPEPRQADLPKADLKQLAGRTEIWLEAQRPALPAPARQLVDGIGVQLDLLAPQLQTLDAATPAAANIRKLVGEDLPELVAGYQRIPAGLRGEAHAGRTPDETLLGGLKMLEREIGDAARSLAAGEIDKLATRERYLQLKYQGLEADDTPGAG